VLRLIAVDLRRHRARTGLTAAGVAIGVAAIVAFLALSNGIERSASGLINLGGAELGVFQAGVGELTASSLPQSLAPRIAAQPGVAEATPVGVATGQLKGSSSFLVFGVDPKGFIVRSLVFVAGRRPVTPSEAVIGDAAAHQYGLRVGDRLKLAGGSFPVVGIAHTGVAFEDQGALLSLPVVGRMRQRQGDATTIVVKIRRGYRASTVKATLDRAFPGTISISQPGEVERVDTNSLLIRKAATVFVALALVIGGIAVMNTMLMAAFERRREFALLLAIGWPKRSVGGLVVREGVAISLAGALVGLGLGIGAGHLLVHAFAASSLVVPHVTAWALGRALLVALGTGALGSLYPAWWVTRLRPAAALA
jgi:putative ABC transport system permease protein